jgi:curli biogenesis system outer membrane secretion channel CsgG
MTISSSESAGYTAGLRDMPTTAMVQTKRFRVLDRQDMESLKSEMALTGSGYTDKTGVTKGGVEGPIFW